MKPALLAAAALSALALAGCASNPISPLADNPACRAEVNADPTVRELMANSTAVQASYALTHKQDLAEARQAVNLRCMREKGLLPPGGVEPVKPVWYKPLF